MSEIVARRQIFKTQKSAVAALLASPLLGAATVLGFAPFYLFPLPIVTLACLCGLWREAESPRRAASLGFAFGIGYFGIGVCWIYISLHDFGGMPAPIAGIGTALLCAYMSLFPAAVGWLQARLPAPPGGARLLLLTPALWAGGDWLRSYLFTGFPWLAIGYSQVPASPLAGFVPILGVYGVSLMTVGCASLLYLSIVDFRRGDRNAWRWPFALVVVIVASQALKQPAWTQPIGEPLAVSLLQGNIAQELKWREDAVESTLKTYREMTLASEARLTILPETALPLLRDQVPAAYLRRIGRHAEDNGGDVLIGLAERDGGDYYNSVFSFGSSPPQTYRKSHLVPFGEFIPPGFHWMLRWLRIPLSDFSRGERHQKPLEVAGQKISVDICYEDVFGEEIIRSLPEATLLVNVSNDAWFGDSLAIAQHLQIAQTRALETGRVMLRATNTGATAAIAPDGRVLAIAPLSVTTALNVRVQGYAGATPYVRWGNGLILVVIAIFVIGAIVSGRRRLLPAVGKKQ